MLLFAIGWYGLWRLSIEYPPHWATVIPYSQLAESPRLALDKALEAMVDKSGRVGSGSQAVLAKFLTIDGKAVTLVAAEAQFYDRSIEPHDVWTKRGKDLLLVSSVDERMSTMGRLAEAHSAGCAIAHEPDTTQALGEASIAPCRGIYGSRFGVSNLARLSVIVDSNPGSENQPCWVKFGISLSENGYQDCVRTALASSLESLFRQLADGRHVTNAIVFPAVATGAGGLSKAAFYKELVENALVSGIGHGGLPSMTLYLQVDRYDRPEAWLETRVAIAGAVTAAVSKWETSDHQIPSSEWLSLTGVALAGGVILLAYASGVGRILIAAGLGNGVGATPLLLVAWLAAAVGIASTFKAFVSLLPTSYGPYVQIAAGAVAATLAGPLTRAADNIKDSLKESPDSSEGDPHATPA
ncbi:hypothetical protein [Sphingomonas natans]|nr:hypothetical protein [Sphingomonas sp. BIUV-7]